MLHVTGFMKQKFNVNFLLDIANIYLIVEKYLNCVWVDLM
jgi:hypothetical protein